MLSMTFLLYKNTVLFSAVLAGIKNPVSRKRNRHFKRSPHCEKGVLLISVVSLIGLAILPFYPASTLLIHVALKKPTSPETPHEIVCTLHIFKTSNESSDKSVD